MNAAANNNAEVAGCLLCEFKQRRCTNRCMFARYFTADKDDDFNNVICLIGIRNLRNILRTVPISDRDRTMESFIREAKLRMDNGAHGSLAALKKLQDSIEETQKEIDSVNEKIQLLKGEGFSGAKSSSEENVCCLWPIKFEEI